MLVSDDNLLKFASVFMFVLVCDLKGGTLIEGVAEHDAEEDVRTRGT
jgi:hypothetical protein